MVSEPRWRKSIQALAGELGGLASSEESERVAVVVRVSERGKLGAEGRDTRNW